MPRIHDKASLYAQGWALCGR